MKEQGFIDVEMIRDGSARWLWQIRGQVALYGAGIAMSATDAQRQAEERLLVLADQEQVVQAVQGGPEWKTETLSLDELDHLDELDRQLGTRPAGPDGQPVEPGPEGDQGGALIV